MIRNRRGELSVGSAVARRTGLVLAVALAVIVASGVASPAPAGADCSGPVARYVPLEVTPGGVVSVSGTGFGTNCYDTGPPPPGEGVLGKPLQNLEIVVEQQGEEWVLAQGAADVEYQFEVEVAVPAAVAPGAATIVVRQANGAFVSNPGDLVVSAPSGGVAAGRSPAEVVEFGPDAARVPTQVPDREPSAAGGGDSDDGPGTGMLLLAVGLLVAIGGGVGVAAWARGRDAVPSGP